ncbi:hypothetical protein JDV02_010639 [Purpureocillium takamizusanense]|uniref:PNPLA domain-containing protein n=1 Tax=Purpureocillium takamizusanense TaxID=2060973 RepID=A0A9Q8QUV6_9HYPO|nr:uncharacterized protein JDV02_010639 [Purpureocillium takamizusanense]UNI24922.1 hypothetical protein JDV02_010639 [Purpureocillium takamizusanense]
MYCSACWSAEPKHKRPGHEQSVPADAITVHTTLRVRLDDFMLLQNQLEIVKDQQRFSQWDEKSEWFGVAAKNAKGDYILSEGPAYEGILQEACSSPLTYPTLVSFVGETGSGKSSLISLLMKFSSSPLRNLLTTPVVGAAGSLDSTSSNVNLYADPGTFLSENPILYADCEGMDGDEIPAQMRNTPGKPSPGDLNGDSEEAQNIARYNPVHIDWDGKMEDGKPVTRKRIAKTLFPRILYIFSDVVVYIQYNRRRLEDTVLQLVKWAHNATEQAYNKPVLPCLVIAFMDRDGQVDTDDYDIDSARRNVFDKLNDISGMQELQWYINYWENNKQTIRSGEDLLGCYYSSVSVVNFPGKTRPTKIHEQTTKLYNQIARACKESQQRREDAWMKLNAATLPLYMRKAFTHFASNYTTPFDFSDAWVDLHQVSFNLQGSIFNLATKVGELRKVRGMGVWEEISGFVASCLLLKCARENYPVKEEALLPAKVWEQCYQAADQYWQLYWPCRYTDDGWGPCINGPSRHVHHQGRDTKSDKKVAKGSHDPSHSRQELRSKFQNLVETALRSLTSGLGSLGKPEAKVVHSFTGEISSLVETPMSLSRVFRAHMKKMNAFYKGLGNIDDFVSHSTCLACLDRIPEHCLPCGHVICSACVAAAGKSIDGGFVELKRCPLLEHRQAEYWSKPWIGCVKPEQAGLRILTLDGGGIKGVTELELLMRIQKCLGEVPLREFFDLIVGTSAGGIIACGLGPGEMDISECAAKFEGLSTRAFSKPGAGDIPVVGTLLSRMYSLFNQGSYKTKPLEDALKETFQSRGLFGGASEFTAVPVKVAVTASTPHGRAIVMGNYNRGHPTRAFYDFQRPPPDRELKLWEAARATSAAPTYFAPFAHEGTRQVYLDGGLWHNNPIRIADAESKAIWPRNKQPHPDIVLSIGAGYHSTESTAADGAQAYHEQIGAESLKDENGSTWRDKDVYVKFLVGVALSQIMSSLNSERIWHEWLEARAPDARARRRYRRLTAELERLVKLDDASTEGIKACRDAVKAMDDRQFRDIADQLIASCFYLHFAKEDIMEYSDGHFEAHGAIKCRLRPESISLLGKYLSNLCTSSPYFRPRFLVKETHENKAKAIQIDEATVSRMKEDKCFSLTHKIVVSSSLAETEIFLVLHADAQTTDKIPHISGFPRKLQHDYEVDTTRTVGSIDRYWHRMYEVLHRGLSAKTRTKRIYHKIKGEAHKQGAIL